MMDLNDAENNTLFGQVSEFQGFLETALKKYPQYVEKVLILTFQTNTQLCSRLKEAFLTTKVFA